MAKYDVTNDPVLIELFRGLEKYEIDVDAVMKATNAKLAGQMKDYSPRAQVAIAKFQLALARGAADLADKNAEVMRLRAELEYHNMVSVRRWAERVEAEGLNDNASSEGE